MKIIATAKRDTSAYSKPRMDSSIVSYKLKAGESVEITGIERYGTYTFYALAGGDYAYSEDIQMIRDVDFFYKNYRSKQLARNNLNMVGGIGLSASLGVIPQYTRAYDFLRRFDDEEGQFIEIDATVGGGITGANRDKIRIPISGGSAQTAGGGLIPAPVQNPTDYSEQVGGTSIGDFFGATGTVGEALKGTTISDLFNGQFLGKVATNLLNMAGTWLNDKLKYVIGFDLSSALSAFTQYNGAGNLCVSPNESGSPNPYAYALPYYGPYASEFDQIVSRQITHAEPTQAMLNYFSYRIPTEGYSLDQYAYQITGSQSSYYTGLPQVPDDSYTNPSKSVEKQFYQKMSPVIYTEVSDKLDKIRENFNLHVDRNTIFNKFNRFRVPTPDNELTTSRGHIFFTRPDLNLNLDVAIGIDNDKAGVGRVESGAHMKPLTMNMKEAHSTLVKYLMGAEAGGDNSFIPILSHCCTGIDVSDDILETQEVGDTFTGWKTVYGTSIIKSKTAGTVNIAFTDDNMLSVYKILKIWTEYINAVWHGEISPKEEYMKKHVLDYAISIYYFLTKSTDDDILFYTKYTGCFPTAVPSSNFSDVLGQPIKRPNYSIPFAYARKDDFDPLRIAEFNHLSTGAYKYIPTYDYETLRVRKSFVGAPFVDTEDRGYLYKLRFRPE